MNTLVMVWIVGIFTLMFHFFMSLSFGGVADSILSLAVIVLAFTCGFTIGNDFNRIVLWVLLFEEQVKTALYSLREYK